MDNFGVVEIASQRRAVAPGWAYVPENSSRNIPPGMAATMAAAGANYTGGGAFGAAAAGAAGAGAGAAGGGVAKNSRKRSTRNQGGAAAGGAGSSVALFSHLTSRQEAKLRKELELLDRDGGSAAGSSGGRDNQIPVPAKAVKAQNKYTPNVRKILASQKSFANHLDDFNALTALHEANPHLYHNHNHNHSHGHNSDTPSGGRGAAASGAVATATPSKNSSSSSRRPAAKKDTKKDTRRGGSAAARRSTSAATPTPSSADTPMADAPGTPDAAGHADGMAAQEAAQQTTRPASSILLPYTGPRPPAHPLDNDPLLVSNMPPLPTDDELRSLVQGPPLTYPEARADFVDDNDDGSTGRRYPTRVFCEICGYWGRVKCTKCGTPVCALDCLELHRDECMTRYGL
ncbi:hit finger domain protein [Sporothrix schenckii 1099-18]|uniref:HIT-type domain-containing protein n=2 Tax=Sporothrix schenckii TaxID=29908 RepID=U7PQW5_SPOS1|nr:hit finger domain protein [Sporothrix schenckii 1099-18]ERS97967.1 hypothetical protein HMPREF1624_06139 [Sporothrix schenckii ATCC 58251]KJR82551.1 hit finger domain protein [Sporothrix schenckii 1099-18]